MPMTHETTTGVSTEGEIRFLRDQVTRYLVVKKGHFGLQNRIFDNWIVANQARLGRGPDDYVALVEAHKLQMPDDLTEVLGVHEEVRKACTVVVEGDEMEMVATQATARTYWIGKYVKLMTPEEAERIPYAGKNGLIWATINGVPPEKVVRANNGLFYPASKNDIVV